MIMGIFAIIGLFSKVKSVFSIGTLLTGGGKSIIVIIGLVIALLLGGYGAYQYRNHLLESHENYKIQSALAREALLEQNSALERSAIQSNKEASRLKKEISNMNKTNNRIDKKFKTLDNKYNAIRIKIGKSSLKDGTISPILRQTLEALNTLK